MEAVQLDQLQQRHEHGDDLLAGVVLAEQLEEPAAALPHPAGDAGHAVRHGEGVPADLPAGQGVRGVVPGGPLQHLPVGLDELVQRQAGDLDVGRRERILHARRRVL